MTDYVLDGRYALIERIATGGMGEVWRGSRPDTRQAGRYQDALRPCTRTTSSSARGFALRRGTRPRRAHPGITRVFDYGEHSPLGGPYLIMELVDGQPLSEILERYRRLDPYVVLDIVAQAAHALDIAHQAGIVHKGIKPGNLLIMADGTTKITDFGIAKANSLQAVNLTATGIVMGTALYVLPEQATGSPLKRLLRCVLARRGRLRVPGRATRRSSPTSRSPSPSCTSTTRCRRCPSMCPRPVADLVYSMLAKSPDGRPESARHVADRAEVIRDAGVRPRPVTADLPVVPNFPAAQGT